MLFRSPDASLVLEAGDELLFVAAPQREAELQALLRRDHLGNSFDVVDLFGNKVIDDF